MSMILKVPVEEIMEKYYSLVEKNIIKNCSIIDFRSLGFDIRVILHISCDDRRKIISILKNTNNTNNVFLTDKGIITDILFDTEDEYNAFIAFLKKHDAVITGEYIISDDIVTEKFLSGEFI